MNTTQGQAGPDKWQALEQHIGSSYQDGSADRPIPIKRKAVKRSRHVWGMWIARKEGRRKFYRKFKKKKLYIEWLFGIPMLKTQNQRVIALNSKARVKIIKGATGKQRALVKALSVELTGKPLSSREMKGMSQKKAGFLISDLKKRISKKCSGKKKKSRTECMNDGHGRVPTSERLSRRQRSQVEVSSSQSKKTKLIVRKRDGSIRTVQTIVNPQGKCVGSLDTISSAGG